MLREKDWWPRTRRMEPISPECEVMEIQVWSSELKIESRTILLRASWASLVSAVTPFQIWSYSVREGSMFQVGKRL